MDEQEILQILDAIQRRVEKGQHDAKLLEDYFAAARMYGEKATRRDACRFSTRVRFWAQKALSSAVTAAEATQLYDLIGRTYLFEAQDLFDSYCIALEWNRPREKRFYQPRRRVLRVVANDMQDLNDGKLDFLGVSLPPRVGKALADDTPVLTADGWKRHGDLRVGDRVAAPDGRFVKVLAVHPKCAMEYEIEFTNGEKIVCHGNHEWVVFNRHRQRMEKLETRQMVVDCKNSDGAPVYLLPARGKFPDVKAFPENGVSVRAIRPVAGGTGNCITVEGGMYCAGRTLVPTHNSTLSIMFMTWRMGKYPDSANVMSGHSDKLTDGFFSEVLSILTDSETYRWNAIFLGIKMADKSAKNETVDLNRKKRFPTLTCRSVGGTLTGAVEVGENGILYTDDLIEDLEESLNPLRLESKYNAYLNQLKDRKKAGARELMIGTRWCVLDPLGRIGTQYADNPRYRFRVIPAVDGEGHSNFQYDYGVGFDEAYYADMKESIDDATWCAKYMGSPYVREGLLFPTDELQYFNGVLPDGEPDRKVMTLDIAWGGGDSTAAPIAYVYDDVAYIVDVVFNNGDKTVTKPEVCEKIARWLPNTVRGEANAGGDEYCDSIDRMLRKRGVHVNIRTQRAPTSMSKLGRIIQYAPDIKQFYFLDEKHQNKEYRAFMAELTTFTQNGKNLHDDAPDCLASLADELTHGLARVTVMKRKF